MQNPAATLSLPSYASGGSDLDPKPPPRSRSALPARFNVSLASVSKEQRVGQSPSASLHPHYATRQQMSFHADVWCPSSIIAPGDTLALHPAAVVRGRPSRVGVGVQRYCRLRRACSSLVVSVLRVAGFFPLPVMCRGMKTYPACSPGDLIASQWVCGSST